MKLKIWGDIQIFYQWDTNRKLILENGEQISEVHFSNGNDPALVLKVKEEKDGTRTVDVPNILLQSDKTINAYMYIRKDDESCTRCTFSFTVIRRPRPEGYVYAETEVLNYSYLDERLNHLEGEGLANAVADYLKDNPVEAGATAEEAAQIAQNKTDIENLQTDKLDTYKLPEAINTALAQAKASGEFDGKDGQDGKNGADGYTPVKGVDYFDGEKGEKGDKGDQGEPGADGAKGDKGDPGEKGADGAKDDKGDQGEPGADGAKGDKGDKGDPGEKGETGERGPQGEQGPAGPAGADGKDGADGKTPVKGTDYYTEADKTEMVSRVLSALPTWNGGSY